jgi:hypothetical protein
MWTVPESVFHCNRRYLATVGTPSRWLGGASHRNTSGMLWMLHRASNLKEFFGTRPKQRKADMIFEIWNVKSLCSWSSLDTAARNWINLHLLRVQEVNGDQIGMGDIDLTDKSTFPYGYGMPTMSILLRKFYCVRGEKMCPIDSWEREWPLLGTWLFSLTQCSRSWPLCRLQKQKMRILSSLWKPSCRGVSYVSLITYAPDLFSPLRGGTQREQSRKSPLCVTIWCGGQYHAKHGSVEGPVQGGQDPTPTSVLPYSDKAPFCM